MAARCIANADVARIKVSNGRAAAVETVDGRVFAAKDAIIGAIHPHLLGGMIDGLNAQVRADAEATHITNAACITVHAALDAPLQFRTTDTRGCGDGGAAAGEVRNPAPRLR